MPPAGVRPPAKEVEPPGFRVQRDLPLGRHPILEAFPGLGDLPLAARLVEDPNARARLFRATEIELVAEDLWMYVAPREEPKFRRGQWKPVISPEHDCIVIGESHLRESSPLMLYMDIFHELGHVVQRAGGAELWPPGVSYVDRWTEVEAYRLVVDDARRLGAPDAFLREYLRVDWISDEEHRALLEKLGVPAT